MLQKKQAAKPTAYAWIVALILLLVSIENQWQRYVLAYAYSYNKKGDKYDTKYYKLSKLIDDNEYAVLSGVGFNMLYSIAGLFMGRAADRYNRVFLVGGACICWSLCTIGSGFATGFVGLLIPRILLGVFEAACTPPSYSIIADYFSAEYRTTANAVFSLGIYIGGGLSSLSLLMFTATGWAWSFIIIGITGLVSAVIMLVVVREPKRGGRDLVKKEQNTEKLESPIILTLRALAEIFTNPTARNVAIAGSFRFVGGFAIGYYHEKYFNGVYPAYQSTFAVINASVISIGGFLSQFIGGIISDRYEVPSNYMAKAWVCIGGSLLGVPTMAMCCFSNVMSDPTSAKPTNGAYFYTAMGGLALEYLVAECWGAPAIAML